MDIKENILFEIKKSNSLIQETETNKSQFETNIKNSYKSNLLQSIINQIENQEKYLGGKKVHFLIEKNTNEILTRVITKEDFDTKANNESSFIYFYELDDLEFIYSKNELDIFIEDLINKRIEYFQNEFCRGTLYQNSSDPMSNLIHSWQRETEQIIYKYLNNLIGNLML